MKNLLCISILLLHACLVTGQSGFIKILDFGETGHITSSLEVDDGYFCTLGADYLEQDSSELIAIKTDKQGNLLWQAALPRLNFEGFDFTIFARGCTQAPDSTLLIVGDLSLGAWPVYGIFVTKITLGGVILWTKYYGITNGGETYRGQKIACYPNGDFIVTGTYFRLEPSGQTFPYPDSVCLFKMNAAGEVLHETKINYPPYLYAGYVAFDDYASSDPVILPGGDIFYGFTIREGTYHPIFARLDSTLQLLWRQEGTVRGNIINMLPSGDTAVLAYYQGGYNNYPFGVDPIVQKIQPDGDSLWTYSPPGIASQNCHDMAVLTNNDIVMTGTPDAFEWLRCISPQGKYKWHRKYRPPLSDDDDQLFFFQVLGASDGGILVTGQYRKILPFPEGVHQYVLLMKLDSLGCVEPGCGLEYYLTGTAEPAGAGRGEETLFELKQNLLSAGAPLRVHILGISAEARLRLFDTSGRTVVEKDVHAFEQLVLPLHLAAGNYWISVETLDKRRQVRAFTVGF